MVVNLILCGIIAGLATALSAAFILPSVAGNELRLSLGQALLGTGRSMSGYAGRIFAPDDHELAIQQAVSKRSLHATLHQYSGLEPTEEVATFLRKPHADLDGDLALQLRAGQAASTPGATLHCGWQIRTVGHMHASCVQR